MRAKSYEAQYQQIKENWPPTNENVQRAKAIIPGTQLVLYIMAGGGMVGRLHAEQPLNAYRDARVGRAPYKNGDIEIMRATLVALAEVAGMDPDNLPAMPHFHAAGIF